MTKIRDIDAHEYREVFLVVERRDGAIYKTKRTTIRRILRKEV